MMGVDTGSGSREDTWAEMMIVAISAITYINAKEDSYDEFGRIFLPSSRIKMVKQLRAKIKSAYASGGAKLAISYQEMMNIHIDRYVLIINMKGLVQLVDAVGALH